MSLCCTTVEAEMSGQFVEPPQLRISKYLNDRYNKTPGLRKTDGNYTGAAAGCQGLGSSSLPLFITICVSCRCLPRARGPGKGRGEGGEGLGKKCGSAEMLLSPGLPTRTVLT